TLSLSSSFTHHTPTTATSTLSYTTLFRSGRPLERVKLLNPFILRTAVPPTSQAEGKRVTEIRRIGKRVVFVLERQLYLVLHLMTSEEHTSELQSPYDLVCRLLLEKKILQP